MRKRKPFCKFSAPKRLKNLRGALRYLPEYGTMKPLPSWQQEGGGRMLDLVRFLVSVAAGMVSHYICKWLDEKKKGS